MRRLPSRFVAAESGNIAIIFAAMLVVIGLAVGVSVDYARAATTKDRLAEALDAATLAAVRQLTSGTITVDQVEDVARRQFEQEVALNLSGSVKTSSFSTTVDPVTRSVRSSVSAGIPTTFMSLAGIERLQTDASITVSYNSQPIELALVLDVTGSMRGGKLDSLKSATREVIDTLLPAGGLNNDQVRISLVPFGASVNLGSYIGAVTDPDDTESTGSCITERRSETFTDAAPADAPFGRLTTGCPDVALLPLSNNRSTLINTVSNLSASGQTAGHIGLAWGWYSLSPRWSMIWPSASTGAAYGSRATKVVLFMTDGEFNTTQLNGLGSSPEQARQICENIKADGVLIYTVAFQAPTEAEQLLADCATSSGAAFVADNGTQLKDAFSAIAGQVRQLWLSR